MSREQYYATKARFYTMYSVIQFVFGFFQGLSYYSSYDGELSRDSFDGASSYFDRNQAIYSLSFINVSWAAIFAVWGCYMNCVSAREARLATDQINHERVSLMPEDGKTSFKKFFTVCDLRKDYLGINNKTLVVPFVAAAANAVMFFINYQQLINLGADNLNSSFNGTLNDVFDGFVYNIVSIALILTIAILSCCHSGQNNQSSINGANSAAVFGGNRTAAVLPVVDASATHVADLVTEAGASPPQP